MNNLIGAILLGLIFSYTTSSAQESDTIKRKLTDKETKELKKSLKNSDMSKNVLASAVEKACKCMDSIDIKSKDQQQIAEEASKCIDNETVSYQAAKLIFNSFFSDKGVISVNTDKKSKQYVLAYREIETELMSSCETLKIIIASNNKESKYSVTENEDAMVQYNLGTKLYNKGKYDEAIEYYEEAVKIDPKFAFAWDNLGLCYRRLNQNEKAIDAYKKSLQINPHGELPLQNMGVAYEAKKDYDKAIEAYQHYLEMYTNAEEGYYGLGRILFFYKNDNEAALDNMCKAYNLYTKMNSPYRVDAEKMIGQIFSKMKGGKSEKDSTKY